MGKQKITYKTAQQWAKYINEWLKEKGVNLKAKDVHNLFQSYGVEPTMFRNNGEYLVKDSKGKIPCYSSASFFLKCYNIDFLKRCQQISGIGENDEIIDNHQERYDLSYKNDENDMEKHSQYLEKMYQTENKITSKTIIISEDAFQRLIEGATYMKNNDDTINFAKTL